MDNEVVVVVFIVQLCILCVVHCSHDLLSQACGYISLALKLGWH